MKNSWIWVALALFCLVAIFTLLCIRCDIPQSYDAKPNIEQFDLTEWYDNMCCYAPGSIYDYLNAYKEPVCKGI